jgi:hypothetical protein
MASQTILILAIGGRLGELVWNDICRWSAARLTDDPNEWAPEDWPADVQQAVNAFVRRFATFAFVPPVLHRCEYVDLWSMGMDYEEVFKELDIEARQLYTATYELYAARSNGTKLRSRRNRNGAPDASLLRQGLNDAITNWKPIGRDRVILLVRHVFGALWDDHEIVDSLDKCPEWYGGGELDARTKWIVSRYHDVQKTNPSGKLQEFIEIDDGGE